MDKTEIKQIFKSWEFLRLIYNGILVVWSVLLIWDLWLKVEIIPFLLNAAFGAIGANVCFFIGPAVEAYINWLGWKPKHLRRILFVMGLVFSMLVVLSILAVVHFGFLKID